MARAHAAADAAADSGKTRYHHGDLKNALQAAASALIAQRGAEAVSLREISQAAGVSHAAAYRHYADKQALLADLAEAGFRELIAINRRTVAATAGGPAAQLQACGRAYVRFGVRQPQLLQLMFGAAITDWQAHPSLAGASAALADTLSDVVKAGQASGALREGDVGDLTLTAWSLVHGLALLMAGRRIPQAAVDAAFVRRASQRCVALLIDGLGRR
ncbi:TetR/AcrR family transcriptional regulator [Aquabacterium sp.]|uniref:TetR/AcrR family transcriptional regulator n=1 Tax=Aquabacterium sp. TaxID=1872578 RepID=UPI002CCB6FF0|nr:TetR/AcrR family transcriptional regulator [Aquabacterium sp.]HSW08488.1 TetR/AcrR family transcriptional regulator [Aquabacterium sp.]